MKFRFYSFKLSGIIIIIFLAQILLNNLTGNFILNNKSWIQPWRFITAIFLHGSALHLIYNLFALILFGSILEKIVGYKKFLFTFFTTGIISNIIAVNFYENSLGASGAIFGVIGTLIIIRPMLTIWAFGMPMPIFIAGILWVSGDLLGTYGFLTGSPLNNTGNIAHLTGVLIGLIIGYRLRYKLKRKDKRKKIILNEKIIRDWEDKNINKGFLNSV